MRLQHQNALPPKMKKKQVAPGYVRVRDGSGKFKSPNAECKGQPVSLRFPMSVDTPLRDRCSDDKQQINAYLIRAVQEQLKRDGYI